MVGVRVWTSRLAAGLLVAGLVLSGCAAHRSAASSGGDLTVLAAASLTGTFTDLAHRFEADHPGVHVRLSFGGSPTLAQQIVQGAPADVFASADTQVMDQVTTAGDAAGTPSVFARNTLEIAVPPDNPGRVRGLADLADPRLKVALCAVQVPCGAAAKEVFAAAGLTPHVSTYEQDVKAALTKVELAEVDAALVYRTDVRAAGDKVRGVEFPQATRAVNDYPIVALKGSRDPALAAAFVRYVKSAAGQDVLRAAGFEAP